MQLLAAIWNPTPPIRARVLDAVKRARRAWPQLDESTLRELNGPGWCLVWMSSAPCAGACNRVGDQGRQADVGVVGLPVSSTSVISRADEAAREWPTADRWWEGQFLCVRGDHATGTLQLVNDPLGMRLCFAGKSGDTWVASNVAGVVAAGTGAKSFDRTALQLLLCVQGTGHGRCLIDGVTMIPGGSIWTWRPGSSDPEEVSYFSDRTVRPLRASGLPEGEIDALVASMRSIVRAAGSSGRPLRAPITGGRDSRVIASMIAKEKIDCEFFTSAAPDSDEARTARGVAEKLGVSGRHTVTLPPTQDVVGQWNVLVDRLILQTDGMVSAWQAANVAGQEQASGSRPIVFGGHGGELARVPYSGISDVLWGLRASRILKVHPAQYTDSFEGLIRPEVLDFAHRYIRSCITRYLSEGGDPRNIPDTFAHWERQRARDGSAIRTGDAHRDGLYPFYCTAYMLAAFRCAVPTRYMSGLHEAIMKRVAPEVRAVPYSTLPAWWHRPAKDLARMANQWVNSPRFKRNKVQHSKQQAWIKPLLPTVRSECLDVRSSVLWEYVDRSLFERLTAPSNADSLSLHVDGLLKVYTLFAYARIGGLS